MRKSAKSRRESKELKIAILCSIVAFPLLVSLAAVIGKMLLNVSLGIL